MTTWREKIEQATGEQVIDDFSDDSTHEKLKIDMHGDYGASSLNDYDDGFIVFTENFVCCNDEYDGYDLLITLPRNPNKI